ncbi:MAG: hypothetical protein AABX19_04205 [Nanoarchaeota archaeon]
MINITPRVIRNPEKVIELSPTDNLATAIQRARMHTGDRDAPIYLMDDSIPIDSTTRLIIADEVDGLPRIRAVTSTDRLFHESDIERAAELLSDIQKRLIIKKEVMNVQEAEHYMKELKRNYMTPVKTEQYLQSKLETIKEIQTQLPAILIEYEQAEDFLAYQELLQGIEERIRLLGLVTERRKIIYEKASKVVLQQPKKDTTIEDRIRRQYPQLPEDFMVLSGAAPDKEFSLYVLCKMVGDGKFPTGIIYNGAGAIYPTEKEVDDLAVNPFDFVNLGRERLNSYAVKKYKRQVPILDAL